ncbi:hypothetical protein CEUSTIGMA_g8153.t1 [Chlamydomonas eustigma]|uniref:Alpha-1,3-glucosyltransferase n=1 Tax=Chlamydomonas eustigma TaxID=1157962 RepID=A0A250XCB3_9CHLO|nr:hypothetical protein CEUSTIGMA_g8153.t1 [Chlamydomonas eustigma]|eukprot:GAX80718.1 hypothetical protein CEUSTIGMA_g8153.t1 [Chlamydomonas eustigma]
MNLEYVQISLLVTALKIALIPSYRSTDFEVHRNWLAITHSLSLSEWYTEDTSVWTLDYPPFFAWFEWLLSHVAHWVDPEMLVVTNLEYASVETVVFQRMTVIASDLMLITAAYFIAKAHPDRIAGGPLMFLLIVGNAGLLLVDHIHFQYNGMLLGILLWSIHLIQQQQDFLACLVFAILLNMKHLFAYCGPVYLVYTLRHYCTGRYSVLKLLAVGVMVMAVFAASFGPFIYLGQIEEVMSRLFPFGRGLTHAYWAANFWALYSFSDKLLVVVLPRAFNIAVDVAEGHLAGGQVGVSRFAVLPQIAPRHTVLLVLLSLVPCLWSLARKPDPSRFASALAYSALCGFMFGYHVHEKAILMALVPLTVWVASPSATIAHKCHFMLLSTAGLHALLPLLNQPQEYLAKILLVVLYLYVVYSTVLCHENRKTSALVGRTRPKPMSLHPAYVAYMIGSAVLQIFCTLFCGSRLQESFPFLPLMLTSVYCALGVSWVWTGMIYSYSFQGFENGGY